MQFVISQIVSAWTIFIKMNIVFIDHRNIDINRGIVILKILRSLEPIEQQSRTVSM